MLTANIIGFGYWGKIIYSKLRADPQIDVIGIVETHCFVKDQLSLGVTIYNDPDNAPVSDLVFVCVPQEHHIEVALYWMDRGSSVWVEKPCGNSQDGVRCLMDSAKKLLKTFYVDLPFRYDPGLVWIRQHLSSGVLGRLMHVSSVRVNHAGYKRESDVVSDLFIHDFSVVDSCVVLDTVEASATFYGAANLRGCHEKLNLQAMVLGRQTFQDGSNLTFDAKVGWVSYAKIRNTIFYCERGIIIWEPFNSMMPIQVVDNFVEWDEVDDGFARAQYRVGQTYSPPIQSSEPLVSAIDDFKSCVTSGVLIHENVHCALRYQNVFENLSLIQL